MRETSQVKGSRAAAYSSNTSRPAPRRIDRIQRGTAEPPSVALLRHILNPAVIVATLFLTVLAYGSPLSQHYLALAALAFLISAQVVSDPVLDSSGNRGIAALLHHRIFTEWLLVSAALLLLAFALKVTELFSRRVILTWFALTPFVVVAAQAGFRRYAAFSALRGKILQSHVIIGANDVGARLARRLRANPHLGTFRGFFDDRHSERLPGLPQEQLLGGTADIANYVRLNSVSSIYICLPMRPDERVTRLLEELKDTTASVYFVPDLYAFDTMQAHVCDIDGIPLFAVRETPFAGMNGVLKRGSDMVFATIIMAFIWPVLLLLAAGVRMSSPGPVLFRQRRYGLYGESINVYKFRTMRVCEDGQTVTQAQRNDPRVTKFGSFLRRTSLDELPQLFNVLSGTMSLVGPRPHAVSHNEEYRKIIAGYMLRHKVRPGITGWAQVNGLRGETETVEKMQRRVEYDLDYLRNWSLRLDLNIMVRTALLVWRDRNAY
jgi:putative colanic acid biosysnthesis UDP-glucose lipid carrier transferase